MGRARVIGISSYPREGDPPAFSMPCGYVDGVRAAGAVPLVLPPGEAQPERLLELIDGLIISGGGDVGPDNYGGQSHDTLYCLSEERDRFELALAKAALARPDIPVFFICRGMQVLNIACGGTLYAHLPEHFGESVIHRLPPRLPVRHPVRVGPGNRLAEILGVSEIEVCSWHHQSVDRLGKDLRALAWANDGVIEALEHATHPWCVGVQWHPEMQLGEKPHQKLFAALVCAIGSKGEGEDGGKVK